MTFLCLYFVSKSFCLTRMQLLVWHRPSPPYLLVELFSLFFFFWNVLFCLYCFVLSLYLFNLLFFSPVFFFGWSLQVLFFLLVAILFSVLSECIFMFRFGILACRNLFVCDSRLSCHRGFDFLSVVFRQPRLFHKLIDELIRDVLLWTPTHGKSRTTSTNIHSAAMWGYGMLSRRPAKDDREEWRERVRDIRATSVTWWWWYLSISQSRSQFRTWLFFSLGSWEKAMWFSFHTWLF